jgi:hypothetical protein
MSPVNDSGSNVPWGKSPLFPADPNAFQPRPRSVIGTPPNNPVVPWHPPQVLLPQPDGSFRLSPADGS